MASFISVGIFAEDQAHKRLLLPLIQRLAREEKVTVRLHVYSATGGHSRVMDEFRLHQRLLERVHNGDRVQDFLVVGIDGNCETWAKVRQRILEETRAPFSERVVVACPDPHIEHWYLVDSAAFKAVVGREPRMSRRKCARDYYKQILSRTVREAGHPSVLGGLEFAAELAEEMNFFRAGKKSSSLKAFVDDCRSKLQLLGTRSAK